jgi:hypothetical protein
MFKFIKLASGCFCVADSLLMAYAIRARQDVSSFAKTEGPHNNIAALAAY